MTESIPLSGGTPFRDKKTVTTRPSLASDFTRFIDKPLPYRVRAITGLVDGEVVAVGGIAYLPDDTHGVFLMADAKARDYPIALHKAARQVLRIAKEQGIRKLVANPDTSIEAAERWLTRLGFKPLIQPDNEPAVWQWA